MVLNITEIQNSKLWLLEIQFTQNINKFYLCEDATGLLRILIEEFRMPVKAIDEKCKWHDGKITFIYQRANTMLCHDCDRWITIDEN